MGSQAFLDLRAGEAEKLQRQRGVEDRPGGAQPIVERVFGPADRVGSALGEPGRDFEGLGVELRVVHRERDQPDALGVGSRERISGPGQDGGGYPGVGVNVAPDFDQLAMHGRIRGVESARIVHGDTQHARVRAIELQTLIAEIAISQSGVPFYDPGLATRTALRIKESRRIGSRPSARNWRRFGISVRWAEAPVRCSAVFTWRSRWPVWPDVFRRDAWLSTDRFRRAGIRAPSRRAVPPP